jgi:ParB/RepB/Spo0J family partition protein
MTKAATLAQKITARSIDATLSAAISLFDIAPENPRAKRPPENIDELAANMASHGQLQPVICYAAGKRFKVTAGRRRLTAALQAGLATLEYKLLERDDAIVAGIAEQDSHVAMHPADQALAWALMLERKKQTAAAIANAFGVSERLVLQRVALASLEPPIFQALATDKITLATAGAWANVPVADQAKLWKRLGARVDGVDIARAIDTGAIPGDDSRARFVTEAVYIAAGGRVQRDLFAFVDTWEIDSRDATVYPATQEPKTWWLDREILDRLVDEKLQAAKAKLERDGWGFVEIGRPDWSRYSDDAPYKTKAERAAAGCFIHVGHLGALEIRKGFQLQKGKKAAPASSKASASGKPSSKPPAMTNTTHERMTRAAAGIVGRALQTDPRAAIIALCAHLARKRWAKGSDYADVLNLSSERNWRPDMRPALLSDPEAAKVDAEFRAKLPKDLAGLELELADWAHEKVDQLFAFLVGDLVIYAEASAQNSDPKARAVKRARLAAIGRIAITVPEQHWYPDAAWFKGCSVDQLAKFAKLLEIEPGKSKTITAQRLCAAAQAKQWVPDLVLELTGGQPSTAAAALAKPAPKAGRKGKGKA